MEAQLAAQAQQIEQLIAHVQRTEEAAQQQQQLGLKLMNEPKLLQAKSIPEAMSRLETLEQQGRYAIEESVEVSASFQQICLFHDFLFFLCFTFFTYFWFFDMIFHIMHFYSNSFSLFSIWNWFSF